MKRIETPAVFGDIGAGDVDHGIEQRDRFGQNGRNILAALGRQLG